MFWILYYSWLSETSQYQGYFKHDCQHLLSNTLQRLWGKHVAPALPLESYTQKIASFFNSAGVKSPHFTSLDVYYQDFSENFAPIRPFVFFGLSH